MTVGYYIHYTSLQAGGIFTHSVGILKQLIKSDKIEKIHLIISSHQKEYFQKIVDSPKIQFNIVDRKNFIIKIRFAISYLLSNAVALYRNAFSKSRQLKFLSKLSNLINPYKKYIDSSQIDVLHVPFQYSPIYNADVPVIITMHDIQEYHYPEYFTISQKLHRKINNVNAINESDHIIVSYDHIKNDLLKYFDVKESKISVCPPSFAGEWFLTNKITTEFTLKNKYELSNRFLLYPAATWKHKNHINLIKAVSKLIKQNIDLQLICTGNKTAYYQKIQEEIKKLNLERNIKFLGIVPEEDLLALYKLTSLVVIPTLYEAGSGPLYEAMRYQVPVICSNVTSLPDTVGNSEFLFDPKNIDALAEKIKTGLNDDSFRKRNIENSKIRIEQLIKIDYSKILIEVYKKLKAG
jgi:glycosyltransferase involved in cell wall biosynthesis